MTTHIYRVIVRGWFDGLDDAGREALLAEVDEHDATRAAFTGDGTLSYDRDLRAFTFRYEMRARGEDPRDEVVARARDKAVAHLEGIGAGGRDLRIVAADMADVWTR